MDANISHIHVSPHSNVSWMHDSNKYKDTSLVCSVSDVYELMGGVPDGCNTLMFSVNITPTTTHEDLQDQFQRIGSMLSVMYGMGHRSFSLIGSVNAIDAVTSEKHMLQLLQQTVSVCNFFNQYLIKQVSLFLPSTCTLQIVKHVATHVKDVQVGVWIDKTHSLSDLSFIMACHPHHLVSEVNDTLIHNLHKLHYTSGVHVDKLAELERLIGQR